MFLFFFFLPHSYTDTSVLTLLSYSSISPWQTTWPWLHHPLNLSVYVREMWLCVMLTWRFFFFHICVYLFFFLYQKVGLFLHEILACMWWYFFGIWLISDVSWHCYMALWETRGMKKRERLFSFKNKSIVLSLLTILFLSPLPYWSSSQTVYSVKNLFLSLWEMLCLHNVCGGCLVCL